MDYKQTSSLSLSNHKDLGFSFVYFLKALRITSYDMARYLQVFMIARTLLIDLPV